MFVDIVKPNGNEEEFIVMAKTLGFDRLIFLYDRVVKLEGSNLSAFKGSKKNLSKALDFLFIEAEEENRFFFEKKSIDLIYGLERVERKDSVHFRKTGMNQVLAKLAFENDITIGFSLRHIKDSKSFGRAIANIRICRKYNVGMKVFSLASNPYQMRSLHDLMSFGKVLGMHPSEAKNALYFEKI